MEKFQSYKMRVALNFEEFQYQLGDFQLRVGKVISIHSENLRGIVMEMEYHTRFWVNSLTCIRKLLEKDHYQTPAHYADVAATTALHRNGP
ncbi:hypothetical protein K7X08_035719 [Anisodus acutangulus]|uniref:Mediator of RNA polymerase II transcription subunit 20 n=1 Tax=Anisodus acutangulus TaxID=402998 RepID=A0A9Q1RD42_9SOLA|nr:hypothetical protein K7X08_035719 [Anisodus acutangulus]